jgi:hypothetical protein
LVVVSMQTPCGDVPQQVSFGSVQAGPAPHRHWLLVQVFAAPPVQSALAQQLPDTHVPSQQMPGPPAAVVHGVRFAWFPVTTQVFPWQATTRQVTGAHAPQFTSWPQLFVTWPHLRAGPTPQVWSKVSGVQQRSGSSRVSQTCPAVQQMSLQTTRGAGQTHCPSTQTGAAGVVVQSRQMLPAPPQFWFDGVRMQGPVGVSQQPSGQLCRLQTHCPCALQAVSAGQSTHCAPLMPQVSSERGRHSPGLPGPLLQHPFGQLAALQTHRPSTHPCPVGHWLSVQHSLQVPSGQQRWFPVHACGQVSQHVVPLAQSRLLMLPSGIVVLQKMAVPVFVPANFAPVRSVPTKQVLPRLAARKSALVRVAPEKLELPRLAALKLRPVRF